jgi:hypothetical protein
VNADLALKQRTAALLTTAESADARTLGELIPLLYDELRELARRQLVRERPDHTLNTTALVHEAYVRLVDDTRVTKRGRAYFFAAAARAMRQVLIDYARRRKAAKRGRPNRVAPWRKGGTEDVIGPRVGKAKLGRPRGEHQDSRNGPPPLQRRGLNCNAMTRAL